MTIESLIKMGLKFVEKAARRIVKLSSNEWGRVEKLIFLMKDASEAERIEIIDAIGELLFPEEIIGGLADPREKVSEESRKRLNSYRQKVGKQIRMRREALNMTQEELAKKTGLPQSHVSRLERGRHVPTYLTIKRIAKALGTKPSKLDPGHNDDEPEPCNGSIDSSAPRFARKMAN
jgi:DNA-binding XRE family transcriptional regulator